MSQALQEFIRIEKYSKRVNGRHETWREQTTRVFVMHKTKFADKYESLREEFHDAYTAMLNKYVLGSQRALQFAGNPILRKEARIYNCAASYIDRPRVFQETMWLLLCGCGVGFSVQKHHVAKLPKLTPIIDHTPVFFTVPDSIEGWSDAVGIIMSSYFVSTADNPSPFPQFQGKNVQFDFSLIRPKGSVITDIEGKAPGPDGLRASLEKVRTVLDNRATGHLSDGNTPAGQGILRPIDAYDIIMYISDAVLSGGIRRSACLAIFSFDDHEMLAAKTGDWYIKNPQRGRSNNSALMLRNKTTYDQFAGFLGLDSVRHYGEPGCIWADSTESLFNPCVTIDTTVATGCGRTSVRKLIGTPFRALVDGKLYNCRTGFVKTGSNRKILYLRTVEGFELRATSNHQIMTTVGEWVKLSNLIVGQKIRIHNHTEWLRNKKLFKPLLDYSEKSDNYTATVESIINDGFADVYDCTVDEIHAFDANGIYVHNCVEANLYGYNCPLDQVVGNKNSGFQCCNLCEINAKACSSEEEFYKACKAAAIIGTLQSGYDKFGYLGPITEQIVKSERLLGVSMTGMMDNPKIVFNPRILETGAALIKATNRHVAAKLGINPSSRTCCLKPAGTTSCILGTSSGIHPHHAKRYFRRVQANKTEPALAFFKKYNSEAVVESLWSAGKTDEVITFLCEIGEGALTKADVDAISLLEHVKLVQKHWCTAGRDQSLCIEPWLNHNVSNTISIEPHEWESVGKFIFENREFFTGISILNASGDKDYCQAPFCQVFTLAEIVAMYGDGAGFASGLIIHALQAFDNNLYAACDCLLGKGEVLITPNLAIDSIDGARRIWQKQEFVARATKFARRYFGDNIKKMTYCLKDIDALKTWCDLKRTYTEVPWDEFRDNRDPRTAGNDVEMACGGGACELIRF